MRKNTILPIFIACLLFIGTLFSFMNKHANEITPFKADADNAGLKLLDGFGATKIADNLGRARHIIVTKDGSVYIKLMRVVNGKGILYLQDNDKDGKYETQLAFGDYLGTGITIKKGYLYASSDKEVFRYKLDDAEKVIDPLKPEKIVTGLIAEDNIKPNLLY